MTNTLIFVKYIDWLLTSGTFFIPLHGYSLSIVLKIYWAFFILGFTRLSKNPLPRRHRHLHNGGSTLQHVRRSGKRETEAGIRPHQRSREARYRVGAERDVEEAQPGRLGADTRQYGDEVSKQSSSSSYQCPTASAVGLWLPSQISSYFGCEWPVSTHILNSTADYDLSFNMPCYLSDKSCNFGTLTWKVYLSKFDGSQRYSLS